MKAKDIVISANNNEEVIVLPVVPDITVTSPQNNEEFKTADQGSMQLIGNLGLRTFSMSSIFPAYEIAGMRPQSVAEPFVYIDFFNKWRREKVPMRMIASRPSGRVWFNLPVTLDSFSYHLTKAGHVQYNVTFSEYVWYKELI